MQESVTLQDVLTALKELGGESQSYQIKNKVTENFGGIPPHYKNETSFRETIQVIIQEHCPQEKKFKKKAVFEKIDRGRFKLITREKLVFNTVNSIDDITVHSDTFKKLESTEKKSIIDSRVGQGVFRDRLIDQWGSCSVTGCKKIDLLIASHIKPWATSSNYERLDVNNGLLLLPNLDSLFDKGYITFGKDGAIIYSSRLDHDVKVFLNIQSHMFITNLNEALLQYLEFHKKHVFKY